MFDAAVLPVYILCCLYIACTAVLRSRAQSCLCTVLPVVTAACGGAGVKQYAWAMYTGAG
jgi:hypothetical protein